MYVWWPRIVVAKPVNPSQQSHVRERKVQISRMATKEKTGQGQLGDAPIECQCVEWNPCQCHKWGHGIRCAVSRAVTASGNHHKLLTLDQSHKNHSRWRSCRRSRFEFAATLALSDVKVERPPELWQVSSQCSRHVTDWERMRIYLPLHYHYDLPGI